MDAFVACCLSNGGTPQGAGTNCAAGVVCEPPVDCAPVPGGLECQPVVCPTTGQVCLPRCVRVEPGTNIVLEVIDCDCISPNSCHIRIDAAGSFFCAGGCPPGQTCTTHVTTNADGTETVCCECTDVPPPIACCEPETGACIDLAPGQTSCPVGFVQVLGPCGPQQACCLPDGTCVNMYLPCCNEAGGMPQGAGTTCQSAVCGDPVACEAPAGAVECNPTPCPTAGEVCLPRCALVESLTGIIIQVLDCECQSPNACHLERDPTTGQYVCVGGCPGANLVCRTTVMDHGDGTQTVCCECVPPEPPDVCPLALIPGAQMCDAVQQDQCISDETGVFCAPKLVIVQGAAGAPPSLFAELCACATPGVCGPVLIDGNNARCPGQCVTAPGGPCLIYVNGVSTGLFGIDWTTLPPGSSVSCGCEE